MTMRQFSDSINNTEFDFDEWVRLAQDDPDAYEDKRKEIIQQVIESTSPEIKRRMQGLQWQIDQIRSTSANPMASCLRISQMMWDSVLGDEGLLKHMEQLNSPDLPQLNKPKTTAKVIKMKPWTEKNPG